MDQQSSIYLILWDLNCNTVLIIPKLGKKLRIEVNILDYAIGKVFFALFNNLEIKITSLYLLFLYFIIKLQDL